MSRTKISSRKLQVVGIFLSLLLVTTSLWAYYHYRFPYGWSHCCDRQLMNALRTYAEDHDGAYPAFPGKPEAALSLLYPKYADANLLRGKTVPLQSVQSILSAGESLSPESCGWLYVEGLRLDDDPSLALFWDKIGLGHNGERLSEPGHTVFFLSGDYQFIPIAEWEKFQTQQQRLYAARHRDKLVR
jgi:hypothetical protein